MLRIAGAMGSGAPDATADAAQQPIPSPVVSNKPAAGQRGPQGLAPRTTYSRVNVGTPPDPGSAVMAQKTMPPPVPSILKSAGARYPSKGADMHEHAGRPTVQEMIKAAMQATLQKVEVNRAAPEQEKAAAAGVPEEFPSERIGKLASAMEYIAAKLANETEGPGSLHVMKAEAEGKSLQPNQTGSAHHQPATTPPMEAGGTKLETNEDYRPPKQLADPLNGKTAAANLSLLMRLKEASEKRSFAITDDGHKLDAKDYAVIAKAYHDMHQNANEYTGKQPLLAHLTGIAAMRRQYKLDSRHYDYAAKKHETGRNAYNPFGGILTPSRHEKESSDDLATANLKALFKIATDTPPAASAAGEGMPAQPADVKHQMGMLSSNAAAINYTKREAKADPKSDAHKLLTEPAQTKATDSVLQQSFAHTNEAGAKISSAVPAEKLAAAKALMTRLQQEVGH